MRKISFFLLIFLIFYWNQGAFAFSEKIEDFSVEIFLQKNSSFLVVENIVWNFGNLQRHGIWRDIFSKGINIKFEKALDELGNEYKILTQRGIWKLSVRIGDPNVLVSGIKTYRLYYIVKRGILFLKDYDELYWNVTGNEWQVPIEKVKVRVNLPQEIEEVKIDCFTGYFGEKRKNCYFEKPDKKTILFFTTRNLFPGEGLTIAIGIPKGVLKLSPFLKILWILEAYWFLLIPFFTFIYLFIQWWRRGKDFPIKKAIIPQYEPPQDLRVGEVAVLLKQKVEPRDITATLVDLAVRGYVKIREIKIEGIFDKKDFEIEKLKENHDLSEYEKMLLDKLFQGQNKILISSLKNRFSKGFQRIVGLICEEMTKKKYFDENPQKIMSKWSSIGSALIFLGILSFNLFGNFISLSIMLSGILFLIFSFFMPRRSEKGRETFWHILGFREYIKIAEKFRAQFYEKENIFEKYLPYAISFNLVDKWASAFEGIYKSPPQWYEGYYYRGTFSSRDFSKALNFTLSSIGSIMISTPGGAKSGFKGGYSGGGFGGGGGKSW